MMLNDVRPAIGAKKRKKRVGCGESSGHGKTSGRGHKGQKARAGGSIRIGFEGGQMPLIRRIPKRGFNNKLFHVFYAPVNLSALQGIQQEVIDESLLRQIGVVKGKWDGIKILGKGEITQAYTFKVHAVSASAKEKIEKAGGKIELIKSTP
ncbi:50S ribosomal protein L15 [Candidatus Methylacidiphilum infernorum]|uniref:Large ribosomal subunit protein uL15 n=1 Tax=Methylacidiphilum infernorum (isolate V4) TaxID=481448 RepID=RL15_METI4|nr:50S ribosomal protein L15 [Candidatus Methylacidiphilum infernorum]B3E0K2.1 RecName: Full=Large ribosomal subunit protein uL15; AltName: Full=50S ribosomal protein L15 [Methylacidiphilum infernorum V4]ACD82756.1 Ribosomal protein L15 [Methylacidiphilum infernorum V4]